MIESSFEIIYSLQKLDHNILFIVVMYTSRNAHMWNETFW